MVATPNGTPERAEVWDLTTGQTSSFLQTTLVVISKGGQKVPRMDSNPMAEAFLAAWEL